MRSSHPIIASAMPAAPYRSGSTPGRVRGARRGNVLIFVAGILALLTIVATAFITRSKSTRETAAAQQESQSKSETAGLIANILAEDVAQSLFVRPVDPPPGIFNDGLFRDSNIPRRLPSLALPRSFEALRNGYDTQFPYNFARWEVVPWTNWPDANVAGWGPADWPRGVGAPMGAVQTSGTPFSEANPIGNPGSSDARWLRDIEPIRFSITGFGERESFKYWRHLSNISRADNEFRVVRDATDVTGDTIFGGLVTDLNLPIEQWLTEVRPAISYDPGTGDAIFPGADSYIQLWNAWMSNQYATVYRNFPPQNLYNLRNLDGGIDGDGDGLAIDDYELPIADFERGTARWNVGRVLADADGDGYTDSFWYLSPTVTAEGSRQIIAVSIVDNSALINANVATRFDPLTSKGTTPADIALFGEGNDTNAVPIPANWNVGALDTFTNRGIGASIDFPPALAPLYGDAVNEVRWDSARWPAFLDAIGAANRDMYDDELLDPIERRWYWLYAGQRPFDPLYGMTPFRLGDELELRLYHGQNYVQVVSRFEHAMSAQDNPPPFPSPGDVDHDILRSNRWFRESNPILGQLSNHELLYDMRRKLTLYSGARNDLLPPWLRWRWQETDNVAPLDTIPREVLRDAVDPDTDYDTVLQNFFDQSLLKLDLREQRPFDPFDQALNYVPDGRRQFHERLPWVLTHALIDDSGSGFSGSLNAVRRTAASYAANILAYRDANDYAYPLDRVWESECPTAPAYIEPGAVTVPQWEEADEILATRYLGMERQPFLVEAFVGHVYGTYVNPSNCFSNVSDGDRFVVSEDDSGAAVESTVFVVQIANPYDRPIVLAQDDETDPILPEEEFYYALNAFGQEIDFDDIRKSLHLDRLELPPAVDVDVPSTMILYAIDDQLGPSSDFRLKWVDFLDLCQQSVGSLPACPVEDHPTDALVINLQSLPFTVGAGQALTDRETYDDVEDGITLERRQRAIGPFIGTGPPDGIVVDRIRNEAKASDPGGLGFVETLERMQSGARPPTYDEIRESALSLGIEYPANCDDPGLIPFPNQYVEWKTNDSTQTHWVQWARVTRAWGAEFDDVGQSPIATSPAERNPRYVYADSIVTTAWDQSSDGRFAGDPMVYNSLRVFPTRAAREYPDPMLNIPLSCGDDLGVLRPRTLADSLATIPGSSFSLGVDPEMGESGFPWFTVDYPVLQGCRVTIGGQECCIGDYRPQDCADLQVYDVSTPNSPVLVASVNEPRGLGSMTVWGGDCGDNAPTFSTSGTAGTRKPTFFDMNKVEVEFADKGFYHSFYPLQMMQKDADFDQIGELANVWLYGHELRFEPNGADYQYDETIVTFSEQMSRERRQKGDFNRFINRLGDQEPTLAEVDFGPLLQGDYDDGSGGPPLPGVNAPNLPSGLRVFDAFVCDGPGVNFDPCFDVIDDFLAGNAAGFTGKATPGLINANTAMLETFRSMPHMYKLVHLDLNWDGQQFDRLPRTALPEAIISYRERYRNEITPPDDIGFDQGPDYSDRAAATSINGIRSQRGMASPAEVLLLDQDARDDLAPPVAFRPDYSIRRGAWRTSFAGDEPFDTGTSTRFFGAMTATEANGRAEKCCIGGNICRDISLQACLSAGGTSFGVDTFCSSPNDCSGSPVPPAFDADLVSGDAEEANLLYAGISNLITTRSDYFTVYFRIRTFRQNPVSGRWDATDPDHVVDDSRYVMLVDRSEVNVPTDAPKILYLEKVPN